MGVDRSTRGVREIAELPLEKCGSRDHVYDYKRVTAYSLTLE